MCAIRVGEEGGSIIFLCVDYTDNFYFYRIYIYQLISFLIIINILGVDNYSKIKYSNNYYNSNEK